MVRGDLDEPKRSEEMEKQKSAPAMYYVVRMVDRTTDPTKIQAWTGPVPVQTSFKALIVAPPLHVHETPTLVEGLQIQLTSYITTTTTQPAPFITCNTLGAQYAHEMQLYADRVIEASHEVERLNGKLRTEVTDFKKKEKTALRTSGDLATLRAQHAATVAENMQLKAKGS
jgi:hypothetical protein